MAMMRLCGADELPKRGAMRAFEAGVRSVCVANDEGVFAMIDNVCPHRQGPLAEGEIEHGKVLCPWHAWAFDLKTGEAEHNGKEVVQVFRFEVQGEEVLIDLES